MKTIDDIRRENISILVKECGSIAKLALLLDRSNSQVSQLKNGAKDSKTGKPRGMHDSTARYIEEKCGKQKGWLDVSHKQEEQETHNNFLSRLATLRQEYEQTPPNERELIDEALKQQAELRRLLHGPTDKK